MREALKAFGGDPDRLRAARARGLAAFVELHIEQGPVLEAEGLAARRRQRDQWSHALRRRRFAASPATPAPCRWRCATTRSPRAPR